ncbi:hypothetical protein [Actinacidiphila soli]|uniref:hypothetical protein n=1 Tax=Actinacidiphila soli TaxID=2487275 RepID=UPI000FCA3F3C|nr:hypothetical protein [Actinacidiphila soli]
MYRHTALAAVALAAGLALTACNSQTTTPPSNLAQAAQDASQAIANTPPKPTGAKRTKLLAALTAINADLGKDQEKAIEAARNQCAVMSSTKADQAAAIRFGTYLDTEVTEAEGKRINNVLRDQGFCDVS